jgi:hypothetical protein
VNNQLIGIGADERIAPDARIDEFAEAARREIAQAQDTPEEDWETKLSWQIDKYVGSKRRDALRKKICRPIFCPCCGRVYTIKFMGFTGFSRNKTQATYLAAIVECENEEATWHKCGLNARGKIYRCGEETVVIDLDYSGFEWESTPYGKARGLRLRAFCFGA